MSPIRTAIVDDEAIARNTVRSLLTADPDIEIVAECSSGEDAVRAIQKLRPELIFLDIQMPGVDGFSVLQAVNKEQLPEVVFVTAYDTHAIRAFAHHALDFLLKPFTDERFHEALRHAKGRVRERGLHASTERLGDLLQEYSRGPDSSPEYPERILVRSLGRVDVVPVGEIQWIESDGNYVRLHCTGRALLHRERMSDLEQRLDPKAFVRIHRSAIVRMNRIRSLKPLDGGEYRLIMDDGRSMTLSRSYRDEVLTRLGLSR
jgi:two-component system LytT family response regulator